VGTVDCDADDAAAIAPVEIGSDSCTNATKNINTTTTTTTTITTTITNPSSTTTTTTTNSSTSATPGSGESTGQNCENANSNSNLGLDEEESVAGSYPPTLVAVEDATLWPSMQDLNTRLRRVITAYQRNYKKEELKQQQKAKVGDSTKKCLSNHYIPSIHISTSVRNELSPLYIVKTIPAIFELFRIVCDL